MDNKFQISDEYFNNIINTSGLKLEEPYKSKLFEHVKNNVIPSIKAVEMLALDDLTIEPSALISLIRGRNKVE